MGKNERHQHAAYTLGKLHTTVANNGLRHSRRTTQVADVESIVRTLQLLLLDNYALLQLCVLAATSKTNGALVIDEVQLVERLTSEQRQRKRKQKERTLAVAECTAAWLSAAAAVCVVAAEQVDAVLANADAAVRCGGSCFECAKCDAVRCGQVQRQE